MKGQIEAVSTPGVKNLTITVTYDNNSYKKGLETAWGFSAAIVGAEKTILFDTGGGISLLKNMEKLTIEPESVDMVVLSHVHPDHSGGLAGFLEKNPNVAVYLPESFQKRLKDKLRERGANVVEVKESLKICENVYSTGQLGRLIKEQSLVIRTNKGLVVITGCAHPGIVKIVTEAKNLLEGDILLVTGGFHLEWATKGRIEKIISDFRRLGVRYAGPGHCSGEKARGLFGRHFGEKYIQIGAGKLIALADLK